MMNQEKILSYILVNTVYEILGSHSSEDHHRSEMFTGLNIYSLII
jgi:hypothetical protein